LTSLWKTLNKLINQGPLTVLDGFEREVYLINGQQPGPLIDVDEGDDLDIFVQNDLDVEATIHWHGKPPSYSRPFGNND